MSGPMHFHAVPGTIISKSIHGLRPVGCPRGANPFPSGLTHPLRGVPQGPRERKFEKDHGQACGLIRGDAARESEPAPQGTASQGSYGAPWAGRLVLVWPLTQRGSETEVADMQSGLISERHLLC